MAGFSSPGHADGRAGGRRPPLPCRQRSQPDPLHRPRCRPV